MLFKCIQDCYIAGRYYSRGLQYDFQTDPKNHHFLALDKPAEPAAAADEKLTLADLAPPDPVPVTPQQVQEAGRNWGGRRAKKPVA